jgi:hypothetical protein
VELVLHLSRWDDNRLTGTVRAPEENPDVREFSGILELIRVFEDLVPVETARPPDLGRRQPPTRGHP